jgi:hypothetical protein
MWGVGLKRFEKECRDDSGVQVARDAEETADDYVMLSVGYAGAIGTSLWSEIKEDRAKVFWLSSLIMTILIPDSRLIMR